MGRISLTVTTPLGKRTDKYTANAADLTMTAANTGDKNQFAASGKNLVLAHNTSGDTAYTVTITNTGDDIAAYSLGAGEFAVFGPFDTDGGWVETDVKVYLEADNAAVKFGVLDLSNF